MGHDVSTTPNQSSEDTENIQIPVRLFTELIELADIGLIEASALLETGIYPPVKAATLHEALALLQEHRQKKV